MAGIAVALSEMLKVVDDLDDPRWIKLCERSYINASGERVVDVPCRPISDEEV